LEVLPYLQPLQFDERQIAAARDRLLAWDGQMRMESPEAALFNIFWAKLVEAAYNDQLPLDRRVSGAHAVSDALYFTLQEPQSVWWDDLRTEGVQEERDAALQRALVAAYATGVAEFGENLDDWRWGALHTITFENATLGQSGIGLIESIFNRGPFPTHGSESVVQKTCWSVIDPYEVLCIPALRQVIDLSNLDNSRMIHSVGQSGHPAHPHYDDFIDPWRTFQYHPSNWSRGNAEAGGAQTLRLEPAP
ncbi:MAG TPA: penicillin acylase family protein, partial [Anaerolineales bacterium]|nr:penicillin acylase family protein [Anaerolineales bacterium]